MPTRSEKLNQLVIGFSCGTHWEKMKGDGARRFCDECGREVFDFAQMQPSEIHDHLYASRGRLCARLTRQDAQLLMAREVACTGLLTNEPRHRFSAIAAGLVTAWLSAGASTAQTGEPAVGVAAVDSAEHPDEHSPSRRATASASGALGGRVAVGDRPLGGVTIVARNLLDGRESSTRTDSDGMFAIVPLTAGVYYVEGSREGFSISSQTIVLHAAEQQQVALAAEPEGSVTLGVLVAEAMSLRRAYEGSDLVVVAEVGPSVVTSREEPAEVLTVLHVDEFIKGTAAKRDVIYRHPESVVTRDGAPSSLRVRE